MSQPFPEQALQQAVADLNLGKTANAERTFAEILEKSPESGNASFGLAIARGNIPAVLEFLKQVPAETVAYPELLNAAAHLLLASKYKPQGFNPIELVAQALRKVAQHATPPPDLLVTLTVCEMALGNPTAAESIARSALAKNSGDIHALFRLARAFDRQGRLDEACTAYWHVLRADSAYPACRTFLAYALSRSNRANEALDICRDFLPSHPSDNIVLYVIAHILHQSGDNEQAEALFRVLVRSPEFNRARTRIMHGEPNWRDDALEQSTLVMSFWRDYGEVLCKQGLLEPAIIECRVSVGDTPEPHRPEIWHAKIGQSPPRPRVTLVSFSNGPFRSGQEHISRTALDIGEVDCAVLWSAEDLRATQYYRDHPSIFEFKRGFGYWAWKPYIIYNELLHCNDDEFVIYHDSGNGIQYGFTKSVRDIVDWCLHNESGIIPGSFIPNPGPSKLWTKRDCFLLMNCDDSLYWEHAQVMATYSVWRNSPRARDFVRQWMNYALDPRIITDHPNVCGKPNLEGFIDHRHDQSVLTNLVIKHGVVLPVYPSRDINGLSTALAALTAAQSR